MLYFCTLKALVKRINRSLLHPGGDALLADGRGDVQNDYRGVGRRLQRV